MMQMPKLRPPPLIRSPPLRPLFRSPPLPPLVFPPIPPLFRSSPLPPLVFPPIPPLCLPLFCRKTHKGMHEVSLCTTVGSRNCRKCHRKTGTSLRDLFLDLFRARNCRFARDSSVPSLMCRSYRKLEPVPVVSPNSNICNRLPWVANRGKQT